MGLLLDHFEVVVDPGVVVVVLIKGCCCCCCLNVQLGWFTPHLDYCHFY